MISQPLGYLSVQHLRQNCSFGSCGPDLLLPADGAAEGVAVSGENRLVSPDEFMWESAAAAKRGAPAVSDFRGFSHLWRPSHYSVM